MIWWHTPPAACAEYHQFVAAEHNSDAVALVDDLLRLLGIHFCWFVSATHCSCQFTKCFVWTGIIQGVIVDAFSELRAEGDARRDNSAQ